jgi:S-adenosylmethionine:tRNA ribosyltransferase-isomerase
MLALDDVLEFALPAELEAHEPPEVRGYGRDDVRLLVSRRSTDEITHARFTDLPAFLEPGDLLVINDSGTLPAELTAQNAAGEPFSLRFSTHLPNGDWVVEPRGVRIRAGDRVSIPARGRLRIVHPYASSHRLWVAEVDVPKPFVEYLLEYGRPIRYPYVPAAWPLSAYQTVYSRELGSAEMPSAGRPFTCHLVDTLRAKGVQVATLTLHTGVASPEAHEPPYDEWYRVPSAVAHAVNEARRSGGRVIAVGTTVVRALETAAHTDGQVHASQGWTDIVITSERGVYAVDGLLTGFHEPKSTHLAMLEALAPREHLLRAYRTAIACGYLWHEFGDVHLIL